MIFNAWGVVLSRRDHGEADRLCSVYTETHGRLMVRRQLLAGNAALRWSGHCHLWNESKMAARGSV